jgi:hypothetical protein
MEVIVVDNASTDGTVEAIKQSFPEVILLENRTNRGFATANNQGIRIARGRYVLLLNSDTEVLDNAISKTVGFADNHPEAAVVGCRVLNPDRTLQPTCFMFPSALNLFLAATYLYKVFPKSALFGRERMSWWDRNDMREVDVVTGCFMLVRMEAIEQVGLLDEGFFMYGEETDWCYRFKHSGWTVVFAPVGQIIHIGGSSTSKVANKMNLQLKAGILQFIGKHSSRQHYTIACVLMGLFFAIRIPFWFARAILSWHDRSRSWAHTIIYCKGLLGILRGWRGLRIETGSCGV